MTREDIRRAVLESLSSVAPETDPGSLDDAAELRDELDLDSMDFLRYVTALHDALHVDVPEADYAKVATVGGAVEYLGRRLAETER